MCEVTKAATGIQPRMKSVRERRVRGRPACGGGWKFGSARKVEGRVEDDDEDGDDDEDEGGEEDDDAEDEEGSPLEEVLCMGMFGGFSVELLPVLLE